jgi:Uma2 family endonuclease
VEVVSPGDEAYHLDEKVAEYLAAGVPLVWVVWPESRTVLVYRQPSSPLGTASRLTAADTISGEDVLPGFSCGVKEFFD